MHGQKNIKLYLIIFVTHVTYVPFYPELLFLSLKDQNATNNVTV